MKPKLHCTMLVLAVFYVTAIAQPSIKQQKTTGGNNDDYLLAFDLTKDGGMIAGGTSSSFISGEKTENQHGSSDYWVVKYDNSGNIQWDKTIGGNDEDWLTSIKQTKDGGYILGGYSKSNISGEKTENSRGDWDYWVVKLNNSGNIEWDKTIGGNLYDELTSLQQSADRGYILGGFSVSNISGEKTQDSRGRSSDYWIVKLSKDGDIQWDKTIGGTRQDWLQSLDVCADGGYILGGFSYSNLSGEKTENKRGASDYWVVKTDELGNVQWDKTLGGGNYDWLSCLQQTNDHGYIIGGFSLSNSTGEKTEKSRGDRDYWVIKLDSVGRIQWDKTIGGDGYDWLQSLQQTSDDGYILGGWSKSNIYAEKTENNKGGYDYWVVKLNKNGRYEWDKTIGSVNDDYLYCLKEKDKNKYVLGGYSSGGISADKTDTSRGLFDFWLVTIKNIKPNQENISLTQKKDTKTSQSFTVYPNPAKDILHIQNTSKATVTLTNQSGKILITKTFSGNADINVSHLPAGLYYLKNNETGAVQKVMIVK